MPNLKFGNIIEALGGIVRGDLSVVRTGATPTLVTIDSDAGVEGRLHFRTGSSARWQWRKADNETGSNAGSNLYLDRLSDAGAYLGTVFSIIRSSGIITVNGLAGPVTWYQEIHPRENATRTTGVMDTPMGVTVPIACTLTRVYVRFTSADASGSTVIQILKNGSATGMPSLTVTAPATNQTWTTGGVALNQNDVLTASITSVGTTPGSGLAVVYTGSPS